MRYLPRVQNELMSPHSLDGDVLGLAAEQARRGAHLPKRRRRARPPGSGQTRARRGSPHRACQAS